MKAPVYFTSATLILLLGMFFYVSCSKDDDVSQSEIVPETVALTEIEKTDLLTLREEEKLARDVYMYSFDKYALNIFKNISESEQTHMDKVLLILSANGMADPASTERGVFNNPDLKTIYNTLIQKVDISVLDALIVGATIEDLDISDIEDFRTHTSKEDILSMYDNLGCGSRNHLRAYYPQVVSNGGAYVPQYISQPDFDAIVNSSNEKCN